MMKEKGDKSGVHKMKKKQYRNKIKQTKIKNKILKIMKKIEMS